MATKEVQKLEGPSIKSLRYQRARNMDIVREGSAHFNLKGILAEARRINRELVAKLRRLGRYDKKST